MILYQMAKKLKIFHINLFCFLLLSTVLMSQVVNDDKGTNKVIIEGKTYYLHVVEKGEGYYRISKKYGVSQKEIHEANPNSIFGLKPGDILYIPVIEGRNSNKGELNKSVKFIYHTIQKGQTLYYLSRKYNIPIDTLKKYNNAAEGELLIGTIFKIPEIKKQKTIKKEDNYIYHTVLPKETLYGISKMYNTKVDTLLKYNEALRGGILSTGSSIRIPRAEKYIVKQNELYEINDSKLEDKDFIYHSIKQGETIYSISKKYNISSKDIEATNPDLNPNELPMGFLLRIPKSQIKVNQIGSTEGDFITHTVRKRETVYSISKKYGIDIKDIGEANPTKILSNIRKGMKLKIPTKTYLARLEEEEKKLELVKLNQKEEEFVDTIKVDCFSYDYNFEKPLIKLALMLPFDLEATRKANIIKKIEGEEEIEIMVDEPELSPRSRTFVEFYEGALIALDSLKKQGVNIQLFTFDTAPDSNRVKEILAQPELKYVDLIIGPAYASNLKYVSDFSLKNKIKLIYPLSSVNEYLNENPYLFQVNSPDTLLHDKYVEYIVNISKETRVVVLKSPEPSIEEEQLITKLKRRLYMETLPFGVAPDFVEISFSEQDIQGIDVLLSNEKINHVVIPSPDEADVSKIVTTLHGVKETTDAKIKLIGFGNWLRFQTLIPEEIHDLDTEILTPYVLDHENYIVKDFSEKYRDWYLTEPFAVSPYFIRSGYSSKYSRYGIWGFDVTYFFLKALTTYGEQFEHCLTNFTSSQVQFNFNFVRNENWGGFYNNGLYVIAFTPSLDIYRKPIR